MAGPHHGLSNPALEHPLKGLELIVINGGNESCSKESVLQKKIRPLYIEERIINTHSMSYFVKSL